MKSDYFGYTISEVIAPSVSTWKERQPTSANCVITVLVAVTNFINSPSSMWKKRNINIDLMQRSGFI